MKKATLQIKPIVLKEGDPYCIHYSRYPNDLEVCIKCGRTVDYSKVQYPWYDGVDLFQYDQQSYFDKMREEEDEEQES